MVLEGGGGSEFLPCTKREGGQRHNNETNPCFLSIVGCFFV